MAARLGGIAGPGELLVSAAGWDHVLHAMSCPTSAGRLTVQGRTEPLEVVHLRIAGATAAAA